MADIIKVKLKKTGAIVNIKDSTARTAIAQLRTEFDSINTITYNGTNYSAATLLGFVAELYESTVFTE